MAPRVVEELNQKHVLRQQAQALHRAQERAERHGVLYSIRGRDQQLQRPSASSSGSNKALCLSARLVQACHYAHKLSQSTQLAPKIARVCPL